MSQKQNFKSSDKVSCNQEALLDRDVKSEDNQECEEITNQVVKLEKKNTLFWRQQKVLSPSFNQKQKKKKKKYKSNDNDAQQSCIQEILLHADVVNHLRKEDEEYEEIIHSVVKEEKDPLSWQEQELLSPSPNRKKEKRKKKDKSNDHGAEQNCNQDVLLHKDMHTFLENDNQEYEEIIHPVVKKEEDPLSWQEQELLSPLPNRKKEKRKKKDKSNDHGAEQNCNQDILLHEDMHSFLENGNQEYEEIIHPVVKEEEDPLSWQEQELLSPLPNRKKEKRKKKDKSNDHGAEQNCNQDILLHEDMHSFLENGNQEYEEIIHPVVKEEEDPLSWQEQELLSPLPNRKKEKRKKKDKSNDHGAEQNCNQDMLLHEDMHSFLENGNQEYEEIIHPVVKEEEDPLSWQEQELLSPLPNRKKEKRKKKDKSNDHGAEQNCSQDVLLHEDMHSFLENGNQEYEEVTHPVVKEEEGPLSWQEQELLSPLPNRKKEKRKKKDKSNDHGAEQNCSQDVLLHEDMHSFLENGNQEYEEVTHPVVKEEEGPLSWQEQELLSPLPNRKKKKRKKKNKSNDDNAEQNCSQDVLLHEDMHSFLENGNQEYEEVTHPVVKVQKEDILPWQHDEPLSSSFNWKQKKRKIKSESNGSDIKKSCNQEHEEITLPVEKIDEKDMLPLQEQEELSLSLSQKRKKRKKRSKSNDSNAENCKQSGNKYEEIIYSSEMSPSQEEALSHSSKPKQNKREQKSRSIDSNVDKSIYDEDVLLNEKTQSCLEHNDQTYEKIVHSTKENSSNSGKMNVSQNKNVELCLEESCGNYDDVMYLAEKIRDEEILPWKDQRYLMKLEVKLKYKVEPQHKIEARSGTHVPSREEIQAFQKFAPVKKGSFSPEEDDVIVNNWKEFCHLHNWDERKVQPFLYLRDSNRGLSHKTAIKPFVQFLAHGLPNRTLYSVYHRFRTLHTPHKVGRYNTDEDEMIINHIEKNKNLNEKKKFVDLAKVLKRTRASLWRRYKVLSKRKAKNCED